MYTNIENKTVETNVVVCTSWGGIPGIYILLTILIERPYLVPVTRYTEIYLEMASKLEKMKLKAAKEKEATEGKMKALQ